MFLTSTLELGVKPKPFSPIFAPGLIRQFSPMDEFEITQLDITIEFEPKTTLGPIITFSDKIQLSPISVFSFMDTL